VGTGLEFRILGPLEVRASGTPVHVGGPRQRALLALLLCHANQVVSRDQLIEELLAGQPAGAAARMLQVQISRLRQALAGDGAPRVLARPPGYLLRVEPGELDLEVFEQRVAAGRAALEQGDPGQAAALLVEAESLWRGRPLADLEFEPFARFEIQRLAELRLLGAEDRIEAQLALGHHATVCPELGRLVAEHPLRERLRGQLMLALYRSGRQAEALETYRAGRVLLVEELGVEPGPGLRQLHEQVLAADPLLDLPAPAGAAATRALPRDSAVFTGRGRELAQLLDGIDDHAADGVVVGIHAIDGMAGIGKTTFAVHAAHQLAPGFPDGQFFLPLHAHTPGQRPVEPADALASLLLTAGLAAQQIPPGVEARAARWRDCVASRKILLVLDDAAGHEQVRPLLPGTAGSVVLITSRRRLTALEDAAVISLDTLPPGEAAELLTRLTGRAGIGATDPAVDELTRLCGYLPLAIGMLASQLRHHPAWTVAGMAAELAAARDRLTVMHAENLSVAAAFGLSYTDLTEDLQRLFRRAGLVPGPGLDAYAVAALDDTSLATARRGLDELYDQHLLAEPAPGRYQLHDLLREHARALAAADDPTESDAAVGRLLDYYLHTALAVGRHFGSWVSADRRPPPGRPPAHAPDVSTLSSAGAWLEAERPNLHAAADYAARQARPLYAIAIPAAIGGFLAARGHWDQFAALHQTALAAARQAGDQLGEAYTLAELGLSRREAGDYPAAAASLAQAVALYEEAGDLPGQGYVLTQLGYVQVLTGDYPAAAASLHRALALARSAGDRFVESEALYNLGTLQQLTGDYPAAAASHQQALALARDLGSLLGQAWALNGLGLVQQETGDYPAAAASQQQALAMFCDLGDLYGQACALNDLGVVQQETGDYPAAAASHQQALALFTDLGSLPSQAEALNGLGLVQQQTGDYPAAAASHQQALALFADLGNLLGQAEALNLLGELSLRTLATGQARDQHTQALAIARDISAALEEARALEGIGNTHLREGNPDQAAAHLQQALIIYQRLGAPAARRVQEALQNHRLTSITSQPQAAASDNESDPPPPARHAHEAPHMRRSATGAQPSQEHTEQPDLRDASGQARNTCEGA
jgi:DNA-binding SARP family transcriptional activator/tetratricopeptide (TPR) repeat protein